MFVTGLRSRCHISRPGDTFPGEVCDRLGCNEQGMLAASQ